MATKVTIELTDEEVAWIESAYVIHATWVMTHSTAILARIVDALPAPLQVGDRIHVTDMDSPERERYVTWIDPDSDRVHYRFNDGDGEWWAGWTNMKHVVKVNDGD